MYFDFSPEKDDYLQETRNITFSEIISAMTHGGLLDEGLHPDQEKYPWQRMFYVQVQEYVYKVPYVQDAGKIFLKTIYPSRVETKRLLSH